MGWRGARVAIAGGCALVVGAAAVGGGLYLAGRDDPAAPDAGTAAGPTPMPSPLVTPTPVLAAPVDGLPQTPAGIARVLAAPLSDDRLGGRVSAAVLDVDTGQVLFDRGAANYVTPASTAKLVTSVALLSVTAPDQRLTTKVVAGSRPGEVVLVGGGDPTLSAARPARSRSTRVRPRSPPSPRRPAGPVSGR